MYMSKPELTFQSSTKIIYGYDSQKSLEKIVNLCNHVELVRFTKNKQTYCVTSLGFLM